MTGTITWMTGFNRNIPLNSVDYSGAITRDTEYYRTGTASLKLYTWNEPAYWVRHQIAGSPDNPSIAIAINPHDYFSYNVENFPKIYLRRDIDTYFELRWNFDTHTMDLYIDDALAQAGGIEVSQNDWFHLQWKIDPDGDKIYVKIDGHVSIDYDYTEAYTFDYCYLVGGKYALLDTYECYFDDWCIGYGDYFGDVRIESLTPEADDTVQWDRSAGTTNYENVDETPQSDTDYNYTRVDAEYDKMDVTDFVTPDPVTGIAKQVIAVMPWVRAKVDVATGEYIKVGVDSASTIDTTTHALAYSYEIYEHIMQINPADSAAWEDADIDALLLYYEAALGA